VPHRPYRIGEIAQRTGLSADTLRYYERAGLLGRPARTTGGFRLYVERDVERLTFIRRAQAVGFSLDEIRDLLDSDATRGVRCRQVRDLVSKRLAQVDERIVELRSFRRSLLAARRCCERALRQAADPDCCPVVDRGGPGARQPSERVLTRKRSG
jgi:DNA-binding transcriptional MerR regulator